MKKTKRVPRKIGGDGENGDNDVPMDDATAENDSPAVVVKRPIFTTRTKKQFASSSSHRTSFGGAEDDGTNEVETSVVRPRKKTSSIHRDALQRNASRYQIPTDQPQETEDERPSYSSTYLDELRSSTPTGPTNPYSHPGSPSPPPSTLPSQQERENVELVPTATPITHIPTDAEIREKKDRRRRLAAESKAEEYISLDASSPPSSDNNDGNYSNSRSLIQNASVLPTKDRTEGRLEHEDEDIAEGFDAFVEDTGRVVLSRSERKAQERARRRDIAQQIDDASASSATSSDKEKGQYRGNDEAGRRRAYDASQTQKGLYGFSSSTNRENETREARRQRLLRPPPVRHIPDLKVVLARFNHTVKEREEKRARAQARLAQLRAERIEIEAEEERIKSLLKEAGERLEKLTASVSEPIVEGIDQNDNLKRGLDSLATLSNVPPVAVNILPRADSSEDEAEKAFPQRRGFAGMSAPTQMDDEDDYY